MKSKLNLGCGQDMREGYLNLDFAPLPGLDVVHDLQQLPLRLDDAQCEETVCQDVLVPNSKGV